MEKSASMSPEPSEKDLVTVCDRQNEVGSDLFVKVVLLCFYFTFFFKRKSIYMFIAAYVKHFELPMNANYTIKYFIINVNSLFCISFSVRFI